MLIFHTEVTKSEGSAVIICDELGYTCVMKTLDDAERELLGLITTHDPLLAAVPPEKRKATFDRGTGVLTIEGSEEMRLALSARMRRLRKSHAGA